VQQSIQNEQGKRFQPDVLVHFPGERCVVIDSKVSLTAYERFVSAESDEERALSLREHLLSVKKHVDELSAKQYQNHIGASSLDSVMMFMPIEPAYLLTVQNDPNLWNYAWEKRVVIISPTNLVATLRIVENMWRLENQNLNAEEIARQCGALYDKFALLAGDLTELGRSISKSYDLHQSTMNKLTDGRGNIVNKLEGIRKLGAKTSKTIPAALTDKIESEEDTIPQTISDL
jgi:DNA recombination protein RmuC